MTAADCREGRCSCAAITSRPEADATRTVAQRIEFGWRNDDGTYEWRPETAIAYLVSPVWAKHLEARHTRPHTLVEHTGDWLIYRAYPHLTEVAETAIARIRWETTDG